MIENILFLGPNNSPLLRWLRKNERNIIWTDNKINPSFILENKVHFVVSYGYRYIIGGDILELLPNRVINLHISLLPFNKGADPNFWSFIENTPKGVSIHYIDEGIDTGNLLIQKEIFFDGVNSTFSTTYNVLKGEIEELFYKHWVSIKEFKISSYPQPAGGTYHKLNDKKKYMEYLKVKGWDTEISCMLEKINSKRYE